MRCEKKKLVGLRTEKKLGMRETFAFAFIFLLPPSLPLPSGNKRVRRGKRKKICTLDWLSRALRKRSAIITYILTYDSECMNPVIFSFFLSFCFPAFKGQGIYVYIYTMLWRLMRWYISIYLPTRSTPSLSPLRHFFFLTSSG